LGRTLGEAQRDEDGMAGMAGVCALGCAPVPGDRAATRGRRAATSLCARASAWTGRGRAGVRLGAVGQGTEGGQGVVAEEEEERRTGGEGEGGREVGRGAAPSSVAAAASAAAAATAAAGDSAEVLKEVRGKTVLLAKRALTEIDAKLEAELPQELRGSPVAMAAGRTAAVGLAVGVAFLSLNAMALLLTVAHAVDRVPGVNRFFESVGLAYACWFYYEYVYKRDGARRLGFKVTEWYTGAKDQLDVAQMSFSKRKIE